MLEECIDSALIEVQMKPYLAELSQFEPLDSFEYPYLKFYWEEPDRFPYLIKDGDEVCGFALVRRETSGTSEPDVHSIAEFYIQPEFRGKNLGRVAVTDIVGKFTGPWLVQVLELNLPALGFWQKVLTGITGKSIESTLSGRFYDFHFTNE